MLEKDELLARYCICRKCGNVFRWENLKVNIEKWRLECPICESPHYKEVLICLKDSKKR